MTDARDDRKLAVSKSFIDKVIPTRSGKALVVLKHTLLSFQTAELYDDVRPALLYCPIGGGGSDKDWEALSGVDVIEEDQTPIYRTGDVTIGSGSRDHPLFVELALGRTIVFGSGNSGDMVLHRAGNDVYWANERHLDRDYEAIRFSSLSNTIYFHTKRVQAMRIDGEGNLILHAIKEYQSHEEAAGKLDDNALYKLSGNKQLFIK